MRFLIRILLAIFLVVSFLLYGTMYAFLYFEGKELATKQLIFLTHKKVTIGDFRLNPPLDLEITDLDIEGLLKIEKLTLRADLFWLFTGNMIFHDISFLRPELTYEKFPSEEGETVPPPKKRNGPLYKNFVGFAFRKVSIRDGSLNFIDHTASPEGININVTKINLDITNTYKFLGTFITNFDLTADIPWTDTGELGKISAEGWLNLFRKDMQARLRIEDIDGVYLQPYYSAWGIDLKKANIEKAKLSFTSDIRSLSNDLTADCHLELTDIVRKEPEPGEAPDKAARVTEAVLDIYKTLHEGKVVENFTFKTRMDDPVFNFSTVKTAMEETIAKGRKLKSPHAEDVLFLPAKVMEGAVKAATDLSKALIVGAFSVGKTLKDAVKDSFRKESDVVSD